MITTQHDSSVFDVIAKNQWVNRGAVLIQHEDYAPYHPAPGQLFLPRVFQETIPGGTVTPSIDGKPIPTEVPPRDVRYLCFSVEKGSYDDQFLKAFEQLRFYEGDGCLISNSLQVPKLGADVTLNFIVELVPSVVRPGAKGMLMRYLWNGASLGTRPLHGSYCCSYYP